MSPKSDNPDIVNGQPSGRPPGNDNDRCDNTNNTDNNIDAPPTEIPYARRNRNRNPRSFTTPPRNSRTSKNTRETRKSTVRSSSSRGGESGPGGQTRGRTSTRTGTRNNQSKVTKKKRLDEYVPFDLDR